MTPQDIAELEAHLWDSIATLRQLGLSEEEAFLVATRRIGHPDELETAYATTSSTGMWPARAFWMAVGCLVYLIAVTMGTIGAYLTLWSAQLLMQQGFGLGWVGLLVRALVFLAVGWFVMALPPRIGAHARQGVWRRLVERPLALITVLILAEVSLRFGAVLLKNYVIAQTSTAVFGRFVAVDQMAGLINFVALLTLALAAVRYRRGRGAGTNLGSAVLPLVCGLLVTSAGCGDRTGVPAEPKESAQAASQTQFEKCMATWKSGDQDAAVRAFLELDLSKPLFSAGTPLRNSETEFMELPAAGRERIGAEILAELKVIKEIAARVRLFGEEASAKGDAATARKCLTQITGLGEQIDKPTSTVIAQKVGQALKRMTTKEQ